MLKKSPKSLERYFKGISNHRRIQILDLLKTSPGISLDEMSVTLKANMKTIAEHTKRLQGAGLIYKHYEGKRVAHELSPYGEKIHKFIADFE
jgi:DNA-binding transcriptional ArsR family regulator